MNEDVLVPVQKKRQTSLYNKKFGRMQTKINPVPSPVASGEEFFIKQMNNNKNNQVRGVT